MKIRSIDINSTKLYAILNFDSKFSDDCILIKLFNFINRAVLRVKMLIFIF